jgi:hypothetical protein
VRFTFGQIVTLDIFKSTLLMVHVSPMHMLHQAKLECVVHLLVIKDKKIQNKIKAAIDGSAVCICTLSER